MGGKTQKKLLSERIRFRIQGEPNPIFLNSGVVVEQDLPTHLGDLYHIHLLNSKEESVDTHNR